MKDLSFFEQVTGKSDAQDAAPDEAPAPQAPDAPEVPHDALPDEARRVLVYLLRHGAVLATQKPRLFAELCRFQAGIRRHLAAVYLHLTLDERQGVAFVATSAPQGQDADDGDAEDEDGGSLIVRRTLTLYDTLMLLVLRKYYQERETAGEQKMIIDLERLAAQLSPFMPLTEHSSLEKKKLLSRVKAMQERKLLAPVRGEDERYEITPLIRYVVNADMLHSLLEEYQRLAAEAGMTVAKEEDGDA